MIKLRNCKYADRLLARFVIEAKTPLAIGRGKKNIMTDSLVATDVNGLPYLPASSISGVIRSMLGIHGQDMLWGYQDKGKGHGSEIRFTEGKILNSEGEVMDGLMNDVFIDPLLQYYQNLPIRQHVCITDKGTAKKHGKFDEQIVYAGTRFCFEIEIVAEKDSANKMQTLIDSVRHQEFRIGGDTRSGFGEVTVVKVQSCKLELEKDDNLQNYLNKPSDLAESAKWWGDENKVDNSSIQDLNTITYSRIVQPIDFVMFGSGYASEDGNANVTTVKASKVDWTSGKGEMKSEQMLIPATSVKGALRHRVAYHFNRLTGKWATSADVVAAILKDRNEVDDLFGYQSEDGSKTVPGRVFFSDVIEARAEQKLLNHVSIDRFTGGAIDGARFTEQVDYVPEQKFNLEIKVIGRFEGTLKEAFEMALDDICEGRLPLGGGVNRGNGIFTDKRHRESWIRL